MKLTNKNFNEVKQGDVITVITADMKFGLPTDNELVMFAQMSNELRPAHVISITGSETDARFAYLIKRYKQAGQRRVKAITLNVLEVVTEGNVEKLICDLVSMEEVE